MPLDLATSDGARANLQERLARLGNEDEESIKRWEAWVREGIDNLADFVNELYRPDYRVLKRLRKVALGVYFGDKPGDYSFKGLPIALGTFKRTLREIERNAVKQAKKN